MTSSQKAPKSAKNDPAPPGITHDEDSIEFSSANKEVLSLMGWFYLINGKFNHSVDLLTALNRIDPFYLPAVKMLCYAQLKCGNYKKALLYGNLLHELSHTAKEKTIANLLKSRALWGSGHREKANELMQVVIADRKEMRDGY
jgi:hypothetical protein